MSETCVLCNSKEHQQEISEDSYVTPRDGKPYVYESYFTRCKGCMRDYVTPDQARRGDKNPRREVFFEEEINPLKEHIKKLEAALKFYYEAHTDPNWIAGTILTKDYDEIKKIAEEVCK